jgi:hypothetical protein
MLILSLRDDKRLDVQPLALRRKAGSPGFALPRGLRARRDDDGLQCSTKPLEGMRLGLVSHVRIVARGVSMFIGATTACLRLNESAHRPTEDDDPRGSFLSR